MSVPQETQLTEIVRLPLALLVTLLSTVLAGCGGSVRGQPLSHDQLVRKGDGICAAAQEPVYRLQRILEGAVYPATFPDPRFTRFYRESRALFRETLTSLRGLTPSTQDAGAWQEDLSGLRTLLLGFEHFGRAQAVGDEERYAKLARAALPANVSAGFSSLDALGLHACSCISFGPGAGS